MCVSNPTATARETLRVDAPARSYSGAKCRASAFLRFGSSFEKALGSRVKQRICIRRVRLCLSTLDVEINRVSGLPEMVTGIASMFRGGE